MPQSPGARPWHKRVQVKSSWLHLLMCLCSGWFLVACESHPQPPTDLTASEISQSDKNRLVPKSLVDQISAMMNTPGGSLTDKGSKPTSSAIRWNYLSLRVNLWQKNEGVLKHDVTFHLNKRGGVVDLSDFVIGDTGTFYVQIQPLIDGKIVSSGLKAYFLSRSRQRKIDGRSFGTGCGRYFDITAFFRDKLVSGGLPVNVTAGRDVSVLAGTFYLAVMQDGRLHLGTLTFKDSRYPQWQCEKSAAPSGATANETKEGTG